jgi:chorismate mutase
MGEKKFDSVVDASNALRGHRERLRKLNFRLVKLLAERMEICMEVAQIKALKNIPMMQPAQVLHVLDTVQQSARDLGLRDEYVKSLFKIVISETCRCEEVVIEKIVSGKGVS